MILSKAKVINELKRAARGAKAIYLAGDPDREGEAICAHLAVVLSTPDEIVEEDPAAAKNGKKAGKAKLVTKPAVVLKATNGDRPKIFRVMFNEITQKAIKAAFEHPTQVNENLVDAQQARRVLDRLVGYKVSPLLWDKVRRGALRGARTDRGTASDCGARDGNPRLRAQGILDDPCAASGEQSSHFRSEACEVQGRGP